jgi:4-amino-4-deoxy-L-arabinose transferase-like glycosyltransferase
MSTEPSQPRDSVPRDLSIAVEGAGWASPKHRSDLIFVALMSFAVPTALLLRWSGLDSQSLWWDEGYTLWISRFSPQEIWHALSADTSTPLYYLLLHYWMKCFGTSDISLRSLSALLGTISIPLVYLVARKILRDKTSVALVVMLYALSFYQIWYAREARCYALLVFLSLGSVYSLLLYLEKQNTLRLCGLVLFLTATLYTHNMALFYLPGIALMWLLYPGERAIRARIRDALLVFSIVLLLYMPWLPTLRRQLQVVHTGFWVAAPNAHDLLDSLCVLLGFDTPTLQAIFRDRFHIHSARLFGFWTWAPAIFLIFVLCILGGLYRVRSAEQRKVAALLAYSLTPVFLVFVLSRLSSPVYINRIFLGSCVLLPVVLCAPIAFQAGNRKKVFQLIGLFVLLGTASSAFGYLRRTQKEEWRGVAEYLLKLPASRRLTVIVPDHCLVLVPHYASGMSKPFPPIEVIGLDPPDLNLLKPGKETPRKANLLALLSQAIVSGRYKEVDVTMQSYGPMLSDAKPTQEYLAAHCSSVEIVEFHLLEVRRCLLQSDQPSDNSTSHKLPSPVPDPPRTRSAS